jgi:hypothetical protein
MFFLVLYFLDLAILVGEKIMQIQGKMLTTKKLPFVVNIYKYLIKNYLHIWLRAKTWLNFLLDDLEKDCKIEKKKD